jgi:hypothetical protein
MQLTLRHTQDRPFDASTLLNIDPEPIDVAQSRWADSLCSLRAANLRHHPADLSH